MTDAMRIGGSGDDARLNAFLQHWTAEPPEVVLELGTLRWEADRPTHHKEWRPDAEWTLSDVAAGTDVDVVADAHDLVPFDDEAFDSAVAVSVWEHLRRPWTAAHALARVVRPGGSIYVATHQTFPIHGYPDDYFRFSDKALALIFEDAGFDTVGVGYSYRCHIKPPPAVTRWNPGAESWLNVDYFGIKL